LVPEALYFNGQRRKTVKIHVMLNGSVCSEQKGVCMRTMETLQSAARRLAACASRPARVILFGSYARGDADAASDVDLMVLESAFDDKAGEYLRLKEAIGRLGVGVDLLLCTEAEFQRRSQVPGTVPYWAKKEGKVLNDAAA
jgi:predicted nucleotidyltransferase